MMMLTSSSPSSRAAALARSTARARPALRHRSLAPAPRASGGGNWFAEGKQKFFQMLAGDYDAASVNTFIDEQIAQNPAVVFSWTTCPYCVKGKATLEATGANFKAIEIDTRPDGKAIKAELAKRTGRTSVPQIWIGGEFVGGCNDGPEPGYGVVPLSASGQLQSKLKAAGAL
jgi:glutaredoxin 3